MRKPASESCACVYMYVYHQRNYFKTSANIFVYKNSYCFMALEKKS